MISELIVLWAFVAMVITLTYPSVVPLHTTTTDLSLYDLASLHIFNGKLRI